MDSRDDRDLARMMWDCMEYTYMHREYIEKMCVLIRKIGESWRRRDLFQQTNNNTHCDMQTQTSAPSTPSRDENLESMTSDEGLILENISKKTNSTQVLDKNNTLKKKD